MAEKDEKPKRKGKRKNESLRMLRSLTRTLAQGLAPGSSLDEEADDTLSRIGSGLASQFYGVDEEGNARNALVANIQRLWNEDERRKKGLPPEKRVLPGLVTDTLSLPNILGNGPEWSQRMQADADATHERVGEDMGLAPARGFRQNAAEAGGMMLGQVPVIARNAVKPAVGALQRLKKFGKGVATSPLEFMLPTIEPSVANYLLGAGAGGALGTLGDEVPEEHLPEMHRAKGGKVKNFDRVMDAIRSRFPKPGVFSVLDNLIEEAPFERGTAEQWKAYLKPGREHMREDVRFPLRPDELRWSGREFSDLLEGKGDSLAIDKEELLRKLRKGRPEFSMTSYGGTESDKASREFFGKSDEPFGVDPARAAIWDNSLTMDSPKFGNAAWRSPGGDDYHEWVTSIPTRDVHTPDYEGGHFPNDTISWSRIQDVYEDPFASGRTESETELTKTRLIDELQSDLHQAATYKLPSGKRLGYADRATSGLDDLHEKMSMDLDDILSKKFEEKFGRPVDPNVDLARDDVTGEMSPEGNWWMEEQDDLDEHMSRMPLGGTPRAAPFMNEGWIRHELQKNLLEAAEQGDEGLAVVHPENIKSRYTENPGLGQFYEVNVVPELERLARRYGAGMGTSGKEIAPVQNTWMRAVNSLNNINVEDDMDDDGLSKAARLALDEIEAAGYDLDNLPIQVKNVLGEFANDPNAPAYNDPQSLRQAISLARNTIQRDLAAKRFDKSQRSNPTLQLTPELREKIKRIGVPLFSTVPGAVMLEDEEPTQDYAEGGKVGALAEAMKVLGFDRRATARVKPKPQEDTQAMLEHATESLPPEEKQAFMTKLLSQDENEVLDALLSLHNRLFPTAVKPVHEIPASPPPLPSGKIDAYGKLTPEEWEAIMTSEQKAKGGKIKSRRYR